MTYIIDKKKCISCGSCAAQCPENAISEVDGVYEINAELCKDHGSCKDVCPMKCITQVK